MQNPSILAAHPQGWGRSASQILRVSAAGWQGIQVLCQPLLLALSFTDLPPRLLDQEVPHTLTSALRPQGLVTHERARVKWKRWRRPRKVMKDRAGKLRVVTWQKGFSKSPDGQSHLKPPTNRLTQVPPFLQTPGVQRPERALTSQCSPGEERQAGEACRRRWMVPCYSLNMKCPTLPQLIY